MTEPLFDSTVTRVATLRAFFSFLHKEGILDYFISSNLKPLELLPARAPEVLSPAQVLRLFGPSPPIYMEYWRGPRVNRAKTGAF